jgi:LysR family transcriptional regulator for bpeEF and oprC
MDKLLWMRCFVRAVETGSFSAVARELCIGQPNVSRHVAALEKLLGTRLLHRSTRQMVVTTEGQRYYTQARQALDIIAHAEAEAHGEQHPHGLLRIACPESIGAELLIPALPNFLQRYPHVDVELRLDDAYIDLVAEGIDIAIRGGKLRDSSLRARRVGQSERICVASAIYLEQRGVPSQPGDLTAHDCIVYTLLAAGNGSWPFKDGDLKVSGRIRLNSLDGIRRAVRNNLGIAYLPTWMVTEELQSGEFIALLTGHAMPAVPVNVLYSAERRLPQRASVFIEFIAQALANVDGLNSNKIVR